MSQTSLRDGARSDLDPAKYVNAAAVPYLVFPGAFHQKAGTGTLGDLGYAVNLDNGKTSAFIVAEVGPRMRSGEMSIALAQALGGQNQSAHGRRQAGRQDRLRGVSESRANPAWPLTNQQIGDRVQDLLKQLPGGMETLKACGADAK